MHKANISFYMCSHFWFIEYASVFNYNVMNATLLASAEIEHWTVSLKEYKKVYARPFFPIYSLRDFLT